MRFYIVCFLVGYALGAMSGQSLHSFYEAVAPVAVVHTPTEGLDIREIQQ